MDNHFVFGDIIDKRAFVDRVADLSQVIKDVSDRQKLFLLSPRRFGKTSLVAVAFERLQAEGFRTVMIPVSDNTSCRHFLEQFANKLVRPAVSWNRVKDWVGRLIRQVDPEAAPDMEAVAEKRDRCGPGSFRSQGVRFIGGVSGQRELSYGGLSGRVSASSEFRRGSIENVLRNAVQRQRAVGYVFAGSQPSLMEEMLTEKRPVHNAGPRLFLGGIPP